MKNQHIIYVLFFVLGIATVFQKESKAQFYRMGAGLSLATGLTEDFNFNTNGNPGFKVKTWYALNERSTVHIVPALTVFNRSRSNRTYYYITNYMFMGDLDGQLVLFHEGTLKFVAFGGLNYTYLYSNVEQADEDYPLEIYAPNAPQDERDFALGANLGAGLEMRMGRKWDMNLQAKYVLSKYSQVILSVEGVYYFNRRRRVMRR